MTNSEEEDERIYPILVTVEVGKGNGLQEFTNLFNGSNERSSSSLPQSQPSSQPFPSSSALLLSSILALSSLPIGSVMKPLMSQLYQNATCLPHSITLVSLQIPIPSYTIPPVFKVPLYIPYFSSVLSPIHNPQHFHHRHFKLLLCRFHPLKLLFQIILQPLK